MQVYTVQPTTEALNAELQLRLEEARRSEKSAWVEAARYRALLRQCCEAARNGDCNLVLTTAGPIINSPYDESRHITKGGASFLADFDRKRIERDNARRSLEEIRTAANELGQTTAARSVHDSKIRILGLVQRGLLDCL